MSYKDLQIHDNGNHEIITGAKFPIKSWTKGVSFEDHAKAQVYNVANMPFIHKHVAIMPDVHAGIGCTVGSVIPTVKVIVPAFVGVDIGCVDADTEYLTPTGWKRIADYTENDQILIFDRETENACFSEADYVKLKCDSFWHIKTKYGVNQMLSDEHKVLFYKYDKAYSFQESDIISASELADKHNSLKLGFRGKFLTTFNYFSSSYSEPIPLTDAEIRIMVMVCADGSFNSNSISSTRCSLKVVKERKMERAIALFNDAGIEFEHSEFIQNNSIVHSFKFNAPKRFKSLSYFWGQCEISPSKHQLQIICDEVFHWDGNFDDSVFFTRDKPSADFMSFAFAACGKRSVMREDIDKSDGKIDYRVFAHSNTKVGIAATPEKQEFVRVPSQDGFKYCFTTKTGFWIMRRGGVIAVTGNCGMAAAKTSLTASDLPDSLKELRSIIESVVPHGRTDNGGKNDRGAWSKPPEHVESAWLGLEGTYRKILDKHPKISHKNPECQIGTLGGGNHFIELCLDTEDNVWIMLHSGSRGAGNNIGKYFTELAKEDMRKFYINLPDENCAYLPEGTQYFNDYVMALNWAQDYAKINREVMMYSIVRAMNKSKLVPKFDADIEVVNCHHNYVTKERHFQQDVWVTRKGAVCARKGTLAIIPGSMGARSFIVRGKGNAESFDSCSHGAGRVMSRTEAKKTFTLKDHREATEGVECRKDHDVIDETPKAYKDIESVMAAQNDLVDIVYTLKQVLCVKG